VTIEVEKSERVRASSVGVAWLAAAVVSLALLALPLAAVAATTTTIAVRDFSFQPKTVTIRAGDTVTWANVDTATHTATSAGNWDTGGITPGSSRSITFATSGTYLYYCLLHSIMFGTIVVVAADATSSPAVVPAPATGHPTPSPASTSQSSSIVLAAAPDSTAPPIVLHPPSEAGPGPMIVAGAAVAIVALSAFAWLVARQV